MSKADDAYLEAQMRINAAQADNSELLNLAIRELEVIPNSIAELEDLETLWLSDIHATDISDIAGLKNLLTLDLTNSHISDISPVSGLINLQSLCLSGSRVTDISPICGLENLKRLEIQSTQISDISHIASLTNLETIHLSKTPVSDISSVKLLEKLQFLDLTSTHVLDLRPAVNLEQLGVVRKRPRKTGIWFQNTPAARADLELLELSKIPNSIERTKRTQAYLRSLPPYHEPLPWLAKYQPAQNQTSVKSKPIKELSHIDARYILEQNYPLVRERCQVVFKQLDDAIAYHNLRIPNDPLALADHKQVAESITFAKALVESIHDALPEEFTDRELTPEEINRLQRAFNQAIEKLHDAARFIDRPDHTPTVGGLLKLGCATAVGSVVALVPGVAATAAIPAVYSCLYGKDAAKSVVGMFKGAE
ncbi:MAG: leucine-rich repeat domain-containing protein [Paracoccaceae bacterium]